MCSCDSHLLWGFPCCSWQLAYRKVIYIWGIDKHLLHLTDITFAAYKGNEEDESKAIFCCRHQPPPNFCSSLLGLEQVPLSGHEHIIKLLRGDYSQDDEKLVAKCMTKQEDYEGLYYATVMIQSEADGYKGEGQIFLTQMNPQTLYVVSSWRSALLGCLNPCAYVIGDLWSVPDDVEPETLMTSPQLETCCLVCSNQGLAVLITSPSCQAFNLGVILGTRFSFIHLF